jgi:D-aspartate ligase
MMWHHVGSLSGVNIEYTQYLDASGSKTESQEQMKDKDIHYIYLKHELLNLLARKGYYKTFLRNIFKSDKTILAVYDAGDLKPFLFDTKNTIMIMGETCLKHIKTALRLK